LNVIIRIVVKFDIHEGITVEDNEDGDHQYADDDEDRHSDGDDSEAEFEEEPLVCSWQLISYCMYL
jgi:hypothetical protein